MRRILTSAAALLSLLLTAHLDARPPRTPLTFSILEDYDKGENLQEVARDFALMRELGVTTWRGSFGWDDYEPEPGRYDFSWLHQFAALADAGGSGSTRPGTRSSSSGTGPTASTSPSTSPGGSGWPSSAK